MNPLPVSLPVTVCGNTGTVLFLAAFEMGHDLDAGGAAATMAAAGGYLVPAELSGLVLPLGAHAPARSRRAPRTLFMPWAVVDI